MSITKKIQGEIDEIAQFGYCDFSRTFQVLIEAKILNKTMKLLGIL